MYLYMYIMTVEIMYHMVTSPHPHHAPILTCDRKGNLYTQSPQRIHTALGPFLVPTAVLYL